MVRLSILVVLVFCLVGPMECGNSARSRDRQNRVDEMYEPLVTELVEIKQILEEIKDQLVLQLCPECGEYEVCNKTTLTCELRGCDQVSDLVNDIDDENITASSSLGFHGPEQSRLNIYGTWIPGKYLSVEEYLQFEFPNMKIVQAIVTVNHYTGGYSTSYNITTSTDCVAFTSTLPIIETGQNSNVTSTFQHPVLAKCVRVRAGDFYSYITISIGLIGCKAESN